MLQKKPGKTWLSRIRRVFLAVANKTRPILVWLTTAHTAARCRGRASRSEPCRFGNVFQRLDRLHAVGGKCEQKDLAACYSQVLHCKSIPV